MDSDVEAHTAPDNLARLTWRMDRVEQRLAEVEKVKPERMADQLVEIKSELKSFRRALTTLIVGVAGALVMYILQKYGATDAAAGVRWW